MNQALIAGICWKSLSPSNILKERNLMGVTSARSIPTARIQMCPLGIYFRTYTLILHKRKAFETLKFQSRFLGEYAHGSLKFV